MRALTQNNFLALLQRVPGSRVVKEDDDAPTFGAEEIVTAPEAPAALPECSFVPLTSVVAPGALPVGDDPMTIEMVRAGES